MSNFLESQIGLLEREAFPSNAQEVDDLIAFQLTTLERLESHISRGGLSENDRSLIPLFQRWLASARKVKERARNLRDAGHSVGSYDQLLRL